MVGRDTRDASVSVADAFIGGVRKSEVNVVNTGVSTTDRTAMAASHYGGIGVMVTASHHAWERTGFKFLYEAGNGFTNDDLDRVESLFRDDPDLSGDGSLLTVQNEFDETYIETAVATVEEEAGGIDATVVVDAVGGAERTAAAVLE
ncbi:MAG: hypothetical protein ABEK12_00060, partial [Candidatus Nanohaloarchaea archaeon]